MNVTEHVSREQILRMKLGLEFSNENNQAIKEMPKRKENEHREPSSNPTPQKPLHGDRLPPQPTVSVTQYTIIATRITNHRHNTPPSPHSVLVTVTNDHDIRLERRP